VKRERRRARSVWGVVVKVEGRKNIIRAVAEAPAGALYFAYNQLLHGVDKQEWGEGRKTYLRRNTHLHVE